MYKRAEGGPAGLIPVVSYARTSEDIRQRDGHGVRHQLRINERTAQERGCTVVEAYSDNGLSASKAGWCGLDSTAWSPTWRWGTRTVGS